MPSEIINYEVGRGTRIYCAPDHTCGSEFPEEIAFESSGSVVAGDTTIAINAAANTQPIVAPFWVKFVDPLTGKASTVEVTSDVAAGALSLTILPAKYDIPSGAEAEYPCRLGGRNSINLGDTAEETEVEDFDNDGWKAFVKTSLGHDVSANGNYLPTDPGWKTCHYQKYDFENGGNSRVYLKVVFPAPGCGDVFQKGDIYEGFALVKTMPIEATPKGLISGNIEFSYTGKVTYTPAA